MDGIRAGGVRNIENRVLVQVSVASGDSLQEIALVSGSCPWGAAIYFRINGHRSDTQLSASSEYSASNFAAISNQNFIEHPQPSIS